MPRPLRFTFIIFLAALSTTLAAVGGWRFARASAPVSGPIIVISIDTLRADHLPAYGYTRVRTPAIDALAGDGVVFERAYSHAPQTLPAHAALLSGQLPFESGIRDNVGFTIKPGERTQLRLGYEHFNDGRTVDRGIPSFAGGPANTRWIRGTRVATKPVTSVTPSA